MQIYDRVTETCISSWGLNTFQQQVQTTGMSKGYKRFHRFSLRKRPDEPENVSERVLRLKEGYRILWDCGNLKFNITKED